MLPLKEDYLIFARGQALTTAGVYPKMLPQALSNPSITAFYVGTQAGYIGYFGNQGVLQWGYYNTSNQLCTSAPTGCMYVQNYVDANGDLGASNPGGAGMYYHATRPWYTKAQTLYASAPTNPTTPLSVWTTPFLFFSNGMLGMTYVIPFSSCSLCLSPVSGSSTYCAACAGGAAANYSTAGTFTGVLAADLDLSRFAQTLVARFPDPARMVFIVDSATFHLLGSSLPNTPVSTSGAGGVAFVAATASSVPVISTSPLSSPPLSLPHPVAAFHS